MGPMRYEGCVDLLGGTAVASFGTATGTRPDQRRFRLNVLEQEPFCRNALVGKRVDNVRNYVLLRLRGARRLMSTRKQLFADRIICRSWSRLLAMLIWVFSQRSQTGGQVNTGDNLVVLD